MTRPLSGFTLIELLVVISIIGVLASVVLVSLDAARANGRDANRITQARSLTTALELYRLDYGQYPSPTTVGGEAAGICTDTGWDDDDCGEFIPALTGSNVRNDNPNGNIYMETAGLDPSGGDGINNKCASQGYAYNTTNSGQNYTLIVMLEGSAGSSNQLCENLSTTPEDGCTGKSYVCFSQ